jgi:hypothetical protein
MKKFSLGSRKSQLLTCTAFSAFVATGLMSPMSVDEAMAACTANPNSLICTGGPNGAQTFNATGDGFGVAVGVTSPVVVTGNNTDTLTVNAGAFDGIVAVTPNSQILIANSGAGDLRHGLVVNAGNNPVGGVNINIDGLVRSNDQFTAFGTTGADSLRLSGTAQSIFNVNVGATGTVGGGTGLHGIHVVTDGPSNANIVNITNAGSIAAGTVSVSLLGQVGNAIKVGDALGDAITGTAVIRNTGTITGLGGAISPVIFSRATGGTTIHNDAGGRIGDTTGSGGDGDLVIASVGSGGLFTINNNGTVNGRMDFSTTSGASVVFNNYSDNSWNTSGITNFSNNAVVGDIVNNDGGTMTTTGAAAINFLAGDDQLINQANGLNTGLIDLNAATVFTFGQGGDLVNNTESSIIDATGAGVTSWIFDDELLGAEFGPQGADTFRNENYAQYTGSGLTTFSFGGNNDDFINQNGASFSVDGVNLFTYGSGDDDFLNDAASFSGTGVSTIMLFDNFTILGAESGPQGMDTFTNQNSATYTGEGITTFRFGGNNDSFTNQSYATVRLDGANILDFGTGDDDFLNDSAGFYADGLTTDFLFGTGADTMVNHNYGDVSIDSLVNIFSFGDGADGFQNSYGSYFRLGTNNALGSVNLFDFGADVDTFLNDSAYFRADGINDIDNLETLTNTNYAWLEFNGLNEIGDSDTTGLNALTNTNGSTFELEGVSFVNFNGNANTFDNTYGGFVSRGATIVDFGGDDDTFENYGGWVYSTGTPLAGPLSDVGVLTFLDLETFEAEGGATDMQDGDVLDAILMLDTTYNNDGDADHYIDAYLAGPSIHGADTMIVNRVEGSGTTWVHVNDLSDGPGEYNPYGVAIVGVRDQDADIDDFRLADGPIEKGFFSYDIYLDQENGLGHLTCLVDQDCFVIASTLGQRSFELPVLAYAAQQMWHTSTGVWTDRTADLRSAFGGTGFGGGGADAIVEPVEELPVAGNVTPGVWGRVFGATQSRDFSNTSAPPPGLEGFDAEFNNNFEQNIYGAMAGIDFGKESLSNQGNQAWIFGLFGGYTGSNLSFDDSDTDVDYTAGSIGAYVTYLNGGLFIDTTIKADFGKMDYNSGGESASADYTSIGGVVDAGYRFTGGTGWYFEPKATLAYVHTDFDNMETFGTDVEFDNGESLRGRLGGRLGTTFDRNGVIIEPYLEASVWNEFSGDYTASFVSNGFTLDPGFDADGVYGEVALGSSFINAGNGWSGFAKGAVQFGEDSALGLTGNLGVRKAW